MTREIRRALVATFIARSAANGALRVVYPFLPAIARGLGVSPAALSSLIALRNLGGLATPVVARLAERRGRRWMMLVAMTAVTLGCILTASSNVWLVAGVGIVLVGFAKPAFDIPMQAWFGDRVPYSERGRIFGITELTWSVGLVAVVPVSGFLIERTSWRAPFILVSFGAAIGTVAVAKGIGSDRPHEHVERSLELTPPRVRILATALLFSIAAEIPFIVYGQWLEGSFALSVAGIGTFTIAIVVAELLGEGLVTAYADRWGLRRMFLGGLLVSGLAYLAFSLTGAALGLATIVVVIWIASFEVTIVAAIPFATEMATEARERLLSLFAVMIATGRAVGALIAQPLFTTGGIGLVGVVSAVCVGIAALLLLGVEEHATPDAAIHP
ncbi:MAG: MFS transporter [Actinobacteria bacterium]|nr:MFS transporter [Actinomycetota bacterium]